MMNSRITRVCGKAVKATLLLSLAVGAVSLTGCTRPYGVPGFSQLVAEAPGQAASFQAPDDGTVYVDGPGRPGQQRHIVFSGLIRRGEILTVDPGSTKLTINGKTQDAAIEGGKSYYQVWFQQQNIDWY